MLSPLLTKPTTVQFLVNVDYAVSQLLLFNFDSAIFFPAKSWREQVNFQWDDIDDENRFVLDQNASLDCYSTSSLTQQSTDRYVAPLGQIILISFQPVFALYS